MRTFFRSLRLVFFGALFGLFASCATTPDPKPAEVKDIEGEKDAVDDEVVAPLNEADRKADEDKEEGDKKEGDKKEEKAANADSEPDEFELGQEVSALLASAVQRAEGDPQGALKLAEQAVDKHPRCVQCHYNKAVLLERQTRFGDAEVAYKKEIALKPKQLD